MAKKTKKTTEETRNITNNFSGFAIFGDAQAVENALVDTLEYGIELTERT